jgi:hypothetical protein
VSASENVTAIQDIRRILSKSAISEYNSSKKLWHVFSSDVWLKNQEKPLWEILCWARQMYKKKKDPSE